MEELHDRLISDLKLLGVKLDFTLKLRPYSKRCYGRYNPNNNTIFIYVYEDKDCNHMYPYRKLLDILLHEFTHYVQHKDPDFVRYKGVMHDSQFVSLFNYYKERLYSLLFWRELKAS